MRRLYQYEGPPRSVELANGEALELAPGQHVELELTREVRELVAQGLLVALKRATKPAQKRRRARRQQTIDRRLARDAREKSRRS